MRSISATAAVLSFAGAALLAQSDARSGWTPTLELRVLAAYPDGARANASGTLALVKAEPARKTVWSGATLCAVGIGGDEPLPSASAPANVWKVSGDYLGEQDGRHQVRVTSGFTRLAGRESSATTTQTLSLRDGDTLVLDAMTGPLDNTCLVHTVTLEARLVLRPADATLARARYAADLWLVHNGPGGPEQREHLITNVDASRAVPFTFNRLVFALPQLDPQQGNAEAFIQLTGALRARTRADGLVDVEIDTNRSIFGLDRPDQPYDNALSTARRTLTLKADETTAIDFPPPSSGYTSLALGDPRATSSGVTMGGRASASPTPPLTEWRDPLTVSGGRLVLNTSQFFRGHRTQLLIRLRRLR